MDRIEGQKGSKESHGLLKLSFIYLFTWTFLSYSEKHANELLQTKGYNDQGHILVLGTHIFTICAALLAQYLVEYHRSCKSLCAMGLLISLPIYILDNFIEGLGDASTVDYTTKNQVLVYTAGTSLLFGLGVGLFEIGALSYCAILSEKGIAGRNFGILISIYALSDFFVDALFDGVIVIKDEYILFITILGVYLVLTLGKPQHEDKCLERCGIGEEGNILTNILTIVKLSPLFIVAATAYYMLFHKGYVEIVMEADHPLDMDPKINGLMMNWVGYIFAVIGPMVLGIFWDKQKYRFHVQITTLFVLFLSSILLYLGYVFDCSKLFILAQIALGLTAFSTYAQALAIICEERQKNKVGYTSALFFYFEIGQLIMYCLSHIFSKAWAPYVFFNICLVIYIVVSFSFLFLDRKDKAFEEED